MSKDDATKGSNMQRRSVDVHLIKVFTFLLKGVDHPFERMHFTSYNFIILKLFFKFNAKEKTQLSYFYYDTTSVSFSCRICTITQVLCHSAVIFLL